MKRILLLFILLCVSCKPISNVTSNDVHNITIVTHEVNDHYSVLHNLQTGDMWLVPITTLKQGYVYRVKIKDLGYTINLIPTATLIKYTEMYQYINYN